MNYHQSAEKNAKVRKFATMAMVAMAREIESLGYEVNIVRWAEDAQYIMVMDAQIRAGMWGKEKSKNE